MKKKLEENSINSKSLLDSPKSNYTNIIKVKKEFSNRSKKFIIINRIY